MQDKNIVMTSDHAGATLKQTIAKELEKQGYNVLVLGPVKEEDKADYPDMAKEGALKIKDGTASRGIFICGSGIGISIAANRFPFIRAALVYEKTGAEMCRRHNDANVLCLGERMTDEETALMCVHTFLNTPFEGGRHACRVAKLGE